MAIPFIHQGVKRQNCPHKIRLFGRLWNLTTLWVGPFLSNFWNKIFYVSLGDNGCYDIRTGDFVQTTCQDGKTTFSFQDGNETPTGMAFLQKNPRELILIWIHQTLANLTQIELVSKLSKPKITIWNNLSSFLRQKFTLFLGVSKPAFDLLTHYWAQRKRARLNWELSK